jgi:hypothetical protein
MAIVIFGPGFGSDAPSWIIVNGVLKPVPGWGVDSLSEVRNALAVLQHAVQLKTPGLAERVAEIVGTFVDKELGEVVGRDAVVAL